MKRDRERGVVAVLAVIVMFAMFGFMALAMNMGLVLDTRAELQTASDSAALAAAWSLDGTTTGISTARQKAWAFSDANPVASYSVSIDPDSDVIFGRWHKTSEGCAFSSGTCDAGFEEAPDLSEPLSITAVKVNNARDGEGSHNPVVSTYFGYFLGSTSVSVPSSAFAIGPGASTPCPPVPLVLGSCINGQPLDTYCGTTMSLKLSSDPIDGIALVNIDSADCSGSAPTGGTTASQFLRDHTCASGSPLSAGDYKMGNGANLTDEPIAAMFGFEKQGGSYVKTSDCTVGTEISFPMADLDCGNPKFANCGGIARFVRGTITQTTDQQGYIYDTSCCNETVWPNAGRPACAQAPSVPVSGPGSDRTVGVSLSCDDNGLKYDNTEVVIRLVK